MAKKDDKSRVLTAHDIISGGEEAIRSIELKSVVKAGKPGIAYIRQLPAGRVLDFLEKDKDQRREAIVELIALCIVNEDGSQMFVDQEAVTSLRNIAITTFNELANAVTNEINALKEAKGNESSEVTGVASPSA